MITRFVRMLLWIILGASVSLSSCRRGDSGTMASSDALPILGPMKLVPNDQGGLDTVFMQLPELMLEDQAGRPFHSDSLRGQIRVVDFFFASCPGICVDMSANMARLYVNQRARQDSVQGPKAGPGLRFLSYTIDPNRDTRDVLAAYAVRHGVAATSRDWLFLRGDESQIHRLAEQYYLLSAGVDSTAPGGFLHSGQFLLLDPKGRIRGLYDGTSADECKVLERDLDALRREWSEEQ